MPHKPDVRFINIKKKATGQLHLKITLLNERVDSELTGASVFPSPYHMLIYTVMKYRKQPQWQPRITEAFSPHDEQNLIMLEFYEVGYFFKQK